MKVQFILILFLIILISSCRKDEVKPIGIWTVTGSDSLKKIGPSNLNFLKPTVDVNDTIAARPHIIRFAVMRLNTTNRPTISTLTGTLFPNIPDNLLTIFTRGNKPLSEIGLGSVSNNTVSGWNVNGISILNVNGTVVDINNKIDTSTTKALSIIITFYPDGYYTFINNKNQSFNEMGWYQLCVTNGLPVGFIYSALHSGADFKSEPRIKSPMQSFGIWGINSNSFFPLIQINENQVVLLNMTPINY